MNKTCLRIIHAIKRLEVEEEDAYGFTITEEAHIASGTLYPSLARLENLGMIESWRADEDKPRRRFYKLSPEGKAEVARTGDPGPGNWFKLKNFIKGAARI